MLGLFNFTGRQQRLSWSPQKLMKGFKRLLAQLFPLNTPQDASIVHGKLEVTTFNGLCHARCHGTPRRIPGHLIGPMVFFHDQILAVHMFQPCAIQAPVSKPSPLPSFWHCPFFAPPPTLVASTVWGFIMSQNDTCKKREKNVRISTT